MKISNYLTLAAILLLLPFCKKAETKPEETTPPKTTTLLCDGNGNSDYFPFKLGNRWVYIYKDNGVLVANENPVSYSSGFSLKKNTYLTYTDSGSGHKLYPIPFYIAKDSANNTVQYESFYQKDFVLVPVAPKLNETWTVASSAIRKIANLNASVKTDACSYTGLLQINHYPAGSGPNDSPLYRYYYKKGLGLVYVIHNPSQVDSSEWMLSNVTIK